MRVKTDGRVKERITKTFEDWGEEEDGQKKTQAVPR